MKTFEDIYIETVHIGDVVEWIYKFGGRRISYNKIREFLKRLNDNDLYVTFENDLLDLFNDEYLLFDNTDDLL